MKRVVVVGAGPCGLAALKEMLDGGHDAVLYERSSALGGLFASPAAYPNLHLTISNWVMAFSDFPDPQRQCYPSAKDYLAYLQSYARHFDLEKHISYNTEVESATLGDDGRWTLEIRQLKEQTMTKVEVDALVVATGSHQVPNKLPTGLTGFGGRIIHSAQYDEAFKRDVAEKNLRVLVVGGGESGADISAELGELSPNVSVWLRRPHCFGPRYLNSRDEMSQINENKTREFPANGFLEAATTNRMSASQNVYIYGFFRRLLWHAPILNRALSRMCLNSTASAVIRNDQATYVTKNQRMCEAVLHKRIEVLISQTISTQDQTCKFQLHDGTTTERDFDAVVLCTGYRIEFPWIKVKDLVPNPRAWFLHCFPKDLGHCLFFVGFARPHQGGIPPMAEMVSRYIALLLQGKRTLPKDYAVQAELDAMAERDYYYLSPNLHTLVDYNAFIETVARRVGCEPILPASIIVLFNLHMISIVLLALELFQLNPFGLLPTLLLCISTVVSFFLIDDALLIKWWFYPNWSPWYRQRGPGASPTLISTVLRRVKFWKSTRMTRGFILLIMWSIPSFYLQRLLSIILFAVHTMLNVFGLRFPRTLGGLLRPKVFVLHSAQWRISDLFLP